MIGLSLLGLVALGAASVTLDALGSLMIVPVISAPHLVHALLHAL